MSSRRDWWTPERREIARQRTLAIQPWRFTTGPRTKTGKARARLNALKHGLRSKNPSLLILGTMAIWEEAARESYQGLTAEEKDALKSSCPQLLRVGERVSGESTS